MATIKTYQIDAFAEEVFKGNPAAVCILDKWLDDELMQSIAAENNLAETAFIIPVNNNYEIRWFTPTVEVDLCGHATLASAYVVFEFINKKLNTLIFNSLISGELKVIKEGNKLFLDFPSDIITTANNTKEIEKGIGTSPIEVFKGKTDYIAVLKNEDDILNIKPNFSEISKLDARGLIVTAKGKTTDFVSRFFAPQSGINEDPVTGSAHTSLTPLWSEKLGKKELTAMQLSSRGGFLNCIYNGKRCLIGGKAKLFLKGEIHL